ncbi:precorrin-6Y C5,15-methyltransferase (decarboxylating) subunit CbiT [Candidatus Marinarcus aquaticus]|uniref:Precorrin-6Y C5,15-methyltransferase (Decarboxylating) subunit CbiT n=1 Tax=Candidatus Marinarcus aquaticus TaxID=2044504 RepID=A0A4Q0XMS3_9BACT|nr:precorrin-6Y C5,15-methyltransferase (decarboxylating) subunit CbiT [Candidatus Marinarcus aquaticus]RXJ54094.1 precorrin-6Y C5,15-methyltransferase (decarboxylating) subunit CbiT [Candidatus Marinarcus aquaticus]
MVTIMGNGMGEYSLKNLNIDFSAYDTVLCDVNFKDEHEKIAKFKYKEIKEYIQNNHNSKHILYVVTGSPLFFSAGALVAKSLPKENVQIINNTSSLDYMMQRCGLSYSDIQALSLHGRDNLDLTQFLTKEYTFILCDAVSIKRLQKALFYLDKSEIEVTIGYKLGYDDECIEFIDIFETTNEKFDLTQPYVLLIKRKYDTIYNIEKDSAFQTQRGMITKQYKRHLSLQNLDLLPNQIFWDVGAGSGSCGIEAYKRYKTQTIFFEKNSERVENIKSNLQTHRVLDSLLLEGEAQTLFSSVEKNPQRIFVGGGGEEVIKTLPYLYERLDVQGIMLINAITLKHLTLIIHILKEHAITYEVFSLSLTTYKGELDLVEPERQLFQIKILKA